MSGILSATLFPCQFFGSLTIGDAKEDAADSFKFIRASDLTSGSKQPTVIITLKLKGISVFAAGSTKVRPPLCISDPFLNYRENIIHLSMAAYKCRICTVLFHKSSGIVL